MPLLTVAECKAILGLEDNTHNERIAMFIPYVQDDIRNYCNDAFMDTTVYRQSPASLAFVRGSTLTSSTIADRITDAETMFSTIGFRAHTDIFVAGGSNCGYYEVASMTSATLTLKSTGEIENESQVAYHRWPGTIMVARVKWPAALKPIAARMVWHLIDEPRKGDVRSESIDDYSVTYAGSNAYPERVIKALSKYRKAILV